jgi:hypothetical protein
MYLLLIENIFEVALVASRFADNFERDKILSAFVPSKINA